MSRGGRQAFIYLPEQEPERGHVAKALAERLTESARREESRGGILLAEINGMPVAEHALAPYLVEAGFVPSANGYHVRRARA